MLPSRDTGDWVGTFECYKGAVWGVALNKHATLAASMAADFSGKVWNTITGDLHSFQHRQAGPEVYGGHTGSIKSALSVAMTS